MNTRKYHTNAKFDQYPRIFSTSSSLPLPRYNDSSYDDFVDDIPDVNENLGYDALHSTNLDESLASSESLLTSFMKTIDEQRLGRIIDEQNHIPSGVRYANFPTQAAHEDHTSETIFGMDMHSLRVGELVNDAIISAFAKIAFANSPHWQQRSIITPYLSKQAELHPERYGHEAVMRLSDTDKPGAPWLPSSESEVMLVPYSRSLHWTLAVLVTPQRQNRRALHQNSLKSDFGHRSALSSILRHCELVSPKTNLQPMPGPHQKDGYNCGAAVCLAMYIWLMHPDPLTFDWERLQEISPDMLDEYRKYILYVVATGDITNIFDGGENVAKEERTAESQECEEGGENDVMDVCCEGESARSDGNEMLHIYRPSCLAPSQTKNDTDGFQPTWFDGMTSSAADGLRAGSLSSTFNNRQWQHCSPFAQSLGGGFFEGGFFSSGDLPMYDSRFGQPFTPRQTSRHSFRPPFWERFDVGEW